MPQVTPLGVILGSQVCGGTPHAWFQRIMLPKMGHAVGVRIALRCGTHRYHMKRQTCHACLWNNPHTYGVLRGEIKKNGNPGM